MIMSSLAKWNHVEIHLPTEYRREATTEYTTYYQYYDTHGHGIPVPTHLRTATPNQFWFPENAPVPSTAYYDTHCTCQSKKRDHRCDHYTKRYYYRSTTSNRRTEWREHRGNRFVNYYPENEVHASPAPHTIYVSTAIQRIPAVPQRTWFIHGEPTIAALYVRDVVDHYLADEQTKGFAARKMTAYQRAATHLGYTSHTKIQMVYSKVKQYFDTHEENNI